MWRKPGAATGPLLCSLEELGVTCVSLQERLVQGSARRKRQDLRVRSSAAMAEGTGSTGNPELNVPHLKGDLARLGGDVQNISTFKRESQRERQPKKALPGS